MNDRDRAVLDMLPTADPTPWWREYANVNVPTAPENVSDRRRMCYAHEDMAKSPYYPEVDPPELPQEAQAAGITRMDLLSGET
ncbi:hypothetical protein [Haloferax sp. YSMS24]|uniref:hypothetical protein n=1 Tax=Haloferax sp. YSMS24 TaxID=3388425 RepID=UPI00398CD9AF